MSAHRTTIASYAASGGAVLFGLTANEVAAVAGAACAVLTFAANIWFKYQHLQLARRGIERIGDGVSGDE